MNQKMLDLILTVNIASVQRNVTRVVINVMKSYIVHCLYCVLLIVFPKRPSQPSPAAAAGLQLVTSQTMSMPATLSVGGTSGGTQTRQFAFSQVQTALKCRLPECDKPCCVEPNGRAHDFCSKAHARAYLAQQQQQKPPQQVLQQPTSSMMSSIGLPTREGNIEHVW